jgi:hypothetical protein
VGDSGCTSTVTSQPGDNNNSGSGGGSSGGGGGGASGVQASIQQLLGAGIRQPTCDQIASAAAAQQQWRQAAFEAVQLFSFPELGENPAVLTRPSIFPLPWFSGMSLKAIDCSLPITTHASNFQGVQMPKLRLQNVVLLMADHV